ncbi:MAG TPA: hypothetical protein VF821_13655 [Lentzea sp.]
MTNCPGSCNAAYRAAVQRGDTDPGDPIPGEPVWCRQDQARIRRQLAELDDLAALLNMQADGHREQGGERGSRGVHQPSPSPIADELDELTRWLLDWEDAYRELPEHNWPSPPRRGMLASTRSTSIAWLGERLDGVLASPFAADFGREVSQWHRRLAVMVKAGTGRHIKPVPCPRCDHKALVWHEGDDHIRCEQCGRLLSLTDYDDLVRTAAQAAS